MKIGHVAIWSSDIELTRSFFLKYFEGTHSGPLYHNTKTGFLSYFLSFNDGCRLEIMANPCRNFAPCNESALGYAHIAISLGSKQKVDDLTQRLANDGFSVVSNPRTTGDGYYESAIIGPDGILIEITV